MELIKIENNFNFKLDFLKSIFKYFRKKKFQKIKVIIPTEIFNELKNHLYELNKAEGILTQNLDQYFNTRDFRFFSADVLLKLIKYKEFLQKNNLAFLNKDFYKELTILSYEIDSLVSQLPIIHTQKPDLNDVYSGWVEHRKKMSTLNFLKDKFALVESKPR